MVESHIKENISSFIGIIVIKINKILTKVIYLTPMEIKGFKVIICYILSISMKSRTSVDLTYVIIFIGEGKSIISARGSLLSSA